jgi:amidophosphoribosyltransferase
MKMDDKHDSCGVCAASVPGENAAFDLYQMISDLQHRGQAGAGLSTYNTERGMILKTYKRLGLVQEVFGGVNDEIFQDLMLKYGGPQGIGHNRYGTSGELSSRHVQPFERIHGERIKWFSFGFNGHIANRVDLEERIKRMGFHLMLDTDTEVIMHYMSRHISETKGDIKEVFSRLSEDFDGAYNIVFIDAKGRLAAMRDPWGIRPLSAIETERGGFVASETCALYRQGTENIRHLGPGEMAVLEDGKITYSQYCKPRRRAQCFFEYIYFAAVTSNINGRSVYETRKRCGEELAKQETREVNEHEWVVIPVPNTARPIANSYAKELGYPQIYEEGLIAVGKGRTFIDEGDRSLKVKRKFLPIPSVIRGKKVVVIDDSIVRSTTMATLVKYHLRELGGASEVHVRIATPPIIAPCYYGIDMRSFEELIAAPYQDHIQGGVLDDKATDEIAERIDADSLHYLTHDGLIRALGLDRDTICMACLNRKYPTPIGQVLDEANFNHFCDRSFCKR